MDENQEYKHICKFCRKGFPCGRSLGGHMRSHMNNTQVEVDERESNNNVLMVGSEVVTHPGYGLRENPKKSWRFSDSRERIKYFTEVCEECGERFKSWKSLLKHMRYHSQIMEDDDEEVEVEEEDSWIGNNQKIVMDSQSDNETAAASLPAKRRRSRRTCRYLIHKNINNSTNSCSSVSEIEHEQEEVAISLMMLSRDVSSNRFELDNSIVESSDNNSSLFLESRSSSLVKKVKEKEGKILFNGDHNSKKKKPRSEKTPESKSIRFETKRSEMGSSGLSRNGINKIKSNGFSRDDKFKNPKYLDELERTSYSRNKADKSRMSELGKNMINDLKYGKYSSTKKSKFDSYDNNSTKNKFDSYDNELDEDAVEKARSNSSEFEIRRGSSRKNKYKCMTCNKNFHSYQALGGHRASHKKIKGCFASRIETSETSTETDISHDPKANSKVENTSKSENFVEQDVKGGPETSFGVKKKSKYECPYCFKVFSSGQALGGHKRSHLVGGSEHRANQTMISHEKLPVTRDLLDLNLPPTGEEETIEDDVGFKPW